MGEPACKVIAAPPEHSYIAGSCGKVCGRLALIVEKGGLHIRILMQKPTEPKQKQPSPRPPS